MDEIQTVTYEVDFNIPDKGKQFEEIMQQSGYFDDVKFVLSGPNEDGGETINFTLPRPDIKRFEKLRKRFEIKHLANYAEEIVTTSVYNY